MGGQSVQHANQHVRQEKHIMIRKNTDPQGHTRITVQWRDGDRVHTRRVATLTEAKRLDGAVRDRGARR